MSSNLPDPLHRSNRVYAIAAILSPYLIRFIAKIVEQKTGMGINDDLMIIIQSGLIEILSQIIAIAFIFWSKTKEKIHYYYVQTNECEEPK